VTARYGCTSSVAIYRELLSAGTCSKNQKENRMKFGLDLPHFNQIATRDSILDAARMAEDEGWDSVWVTDHVVMPSPPPRPYGHFYEAITTLALVGGMTQRVKLGTSAIVLAQRNPIIVAKQISTLDTLSQGRVILGVTAGWIESEFELLGADFHRRAQILEEGVGVLRALWTQETPSFSGQFFRFANTVFSPKPAQPHLPIWICGKSDRTVERAARIGDGWHMAGATPERVKQVVELIHPHLDGRPFTYSVRIRAPSSIEGALPLVEAYRDAGVEHIVFGYVDADIRTMLTHARGLARELLPEFSV
jgi:probable F420-dependent oxidoreductase